MKKQIFNPYLPPYEYIPDGEPHIFGDRLYVYGSHDRFGGEWFCENDYVAWSAPLEDLSDWRFEGEIFRKDQDPKRERNLYAPDVTRGPDGKYYLYYSKDDSSVIGVAVCDTPAGKYRYYGEVTYPDGRVLGDDESEYFMFDPSILIDGDRIWLYSGSGARPTTTGLKRNMVGCTVTELEPDMKTVKTPPKVVLPSSGEWMTTDYFEGPSARKIGDLYYIIYPVMDFSGLHYATSRCPDRDFVHRGLVHSTSDVGLNGHTQRYPAYPVGNSHGGLVEVNGQWYIFDHRMTNDSDYSRQGVAEPVEILPDGSICRAEATSCGLNGGPLRGTGTYPAYIACNVIGRKCFGRYMEKKSRPYVTQSGPDGDENCDHYVSNMANGSLVGYKYFDFEAGTHELRLMTRGGGAEITVLTEENGTPCGKVTVPGSENWQESAGSITVKQGKQALFFHTKCKNPIELLSFTIGD